MRSIWSHTQPSTQTSSYFIEGKKIIIISGIFAIKITPLVLYVRLSVNPSITLLFVEVNVSFMFGFVWIDVVIPRQRWLSECLHSYLYMCEQRACSCTKNDHPSPYYIRRWRSFQKLFSPAKCFSVGALIPFISIAANGCVSDAALFPTMYS